ncbi:hypothetical protein FOA52_014581 [Chlamydomonas sp. UWO 241]|nr:hypothetical protein FOA52_014581 [Chlamydomonas sp. UWO 241]
MHHAAYGDDPAECIPVQAVEHAAALTIQDAWRSFRNRRIFNYYRDLIQFRERGDPRELLRSINPREAQLADAASGIHVRFRLGGSVFPPLVFYKIFTHITVTDIGAFCPRDYASESRDNATESRAAVAAAAATRPGAKNTFIAGGIGGGNGSGNGGTGTGYGSGSDGGARGTRGTRGAPLRGARAAAADAAASAADFDLELSLLEFVRPDGTVGLRDTRGWYERVEHNGWRPIAERILFEGEDATTAKTQPMFHYSPVVRREEKARRAKQRKRDWMAKMYREGLEGGGTPGSSPESDDFDDDPTTDDLLQWTLHLDFEEYVSDWTSAACSLGTEALVPELESAYLRQAPAPSHDLRGAMATAGVPLEPFKGGATPAAGAHVLAQLR